MLLCSEQSLPVHTTLAKQQVNTQVRDSLVLITEVADGVPSLMTVLDNNKWTYDDICENCSNWY